MEKFLTSWILGKGADLYQWGAETVVPLCDTCLSYCRDSSAVKSELFMLGLKKKK